MTRLIQFARIGMATSLIALLPALAQAECYATYKAKRENPLKLHFGVAAIPQSNCSKPGASAYLAPRLAKDGWILLTITAMVDEPELEALKDSVGAFFLKY